MFAAITTVSGDPAQMEEAIDLFRQSVVPSIKGHPGGVEATLLVNRQTGETIALALYETEEAMLAWESSGKRDEVLGQFAPFMTAPPGERQVYEVAVRE